MKREESWIAQITAARRGMPLDPDNDLGQSSTCFVGEAMAELRLSWQAADQNTYNMGILVGNYTYDLDVLEDYLFRVRESAAMGQWPRALEYEKQTLDTGAWFPPEEAEAVVSEQPELVLV